MKNIFIFVIASLAYTSTFGQLTTTEEEYNYLQKGYHTDLESGRDLKEGYDVDELGKWTKKHISKTLFDDSEFERSIEVYSLIRESEKQPCAFLVIFKRSNSEFEKFITIPTYNSSDVLWDRTYSQLKEAFKESSQSSYLWSTLKMFTYVVDRCLSNK